MLGFGAMGEFALGQVPILPAYSPGVFIGDVAGFIKEQEKRSRERDREWQRDDEIRVQRRYDLLTALAGPEIEYSYRPQTKFASTPQTMGLTSDILGAKGKIKNYKLQKEIEAEEEALERLLMEL